MRGVGTEGVIGDIGGWRGEEFALYTTYEGLNLANLKRRKLGVFDRKLEGSH